MSIYTQKIKLIKRLFPKTLNFWVLWACLIQFTLKLWHQLRALLEVRLHLLLRNCRFATPYTLGTPRHSQAHSPHKILYQLIENTDVYLNAKSHTRIGILLDMEFAQKH